MSRAIAIIALVAALPLAGCANIVTPADDDYQLGDATASYCETTDPTVRRAGRLLAAQAGLNLVDLCRARELLEAGE